MKKEARQHAESIFFKANGKISNVEIAEKAGVSSLTIGKWKRAGDWTAKLTEASEKGEEKVRPRPAGKQGARDEAVKLYLKSQGKIGNKELASKVGVSRASIASWKASDHWAEKLMKSEERLSPEPVPVGVPVETDLIEEEQLESIEIDLDELTCPRHITKLNEKIDDMLSREYLSPADIKTVAEAKEAVLSVVSAYMDIIERASED